MKSEVYIAKPAAEHPLLDDISKPALVAWFRCNSCITCKWREEVVDEHPWLTIHECSRMHDKTNIVDMVKLLEYTRE